MDLSSEINQLGLYHIILGGLTLICALLVVLNRNPIVSALGLMGTLFLTGGLYFGLGYYFAGAVQILVYAGAIAVLFVFIVMLLDLKPLKLLIPGRMFALSLAAAAGIFLFSAMFLATVIPGNHLPVSEAPQLAIGAENITSEAAMAISNRMLSKYMLAFQLTGILILAAIMGAVVLGKPKKQESLR